MINMITKLCKIVCLYDLVITISFSFAHNSKTITFEIPVDCTEQREVKRQKAREKYASMQANKKSRVEC